MHMRGDVQLGEETVLFKKIEKNQDRLVFWKEKIIFHRLSVYIPSSVQAKRTRHILTRKIIQIKNPIA
uniref:Uncharacterized protein n=1 Tax=viral metagenome TaxID=1070528 RepID=A0A6C0JQL1_9ZZZZ